MRGGGGQDAAVVRGRHDEAVIMGGGGHDEAVIMGRRGGGTR